MFLFSNSIHSGATVQKEAISTKEKEKKVRYVEKKKLEMVFGLA